MKLHDSKALANVYNSGFGPELRLAVVILLFVCLNAVEAQTNYQRIRSFGPFANGANPYSRLIEGSDGLLYGTTRAGGSTGVGTVFSLQKDGNSFAVVMNFTNGVFPVGGLVEGTNGLLYGTTQNGGAYGYGVAFKLSKNGGDFAVLHEFVSNPADGGLPSADLTVGNEGAIFGTTIQGGSNNAGTVFAIGPDGTGYTNLHYFAGTGSGDGSNPYAGLLCGNDGVLYGTTQNGGSNNFGAAFRLNKDGSGYAVLHHFGGTAAGDGRQPLGTLVQGSDGSLYGTTYYGGTNDRGTIFKLNTNGDNYSVLRSFAGFPGGYQPWGGLVEGANGILYGTTRFGGDFDVGTVFRVSTNGSGYTTLHQFESSGGDGRLPQAALLLFASDGALYGVTPFGGDSTFGAVFRLLTSPPQISITSLSLDQNGALLKLNGGAAGQIYNIEASTNLATINNWLVIGSVGAGIDGQFEFLDAAATNYPARFYRSSTP